MSRVRQRRSRTPGVVRPHRARVQLSDEELATLTARAQAAGVGVPEFLVLRALEDEGVLADRQHILTELLAVRRLLAGAAVNLNQVAKVANSTGVVPRVQLDAEVSWLRRVAGPGGRLDGVLERMAVPVRKGKRSA